MSTIAELSVKVSADLSALQSGLNKVPAMLEAVSAQAATAGKGLQQAGESGAAGMNRFTTQLAAAQAQLAKLNGDSLADLRQKFNGLVPDSELAKLRDAKDQISAIAAAERAAATEAKAQAAAIREIEQAESQAAKAAEKAAAQEIAAAERAAKAQQSAVNAAMAAREAALNQVGALAGQIGATMERAGEIVLASVGKAVKAAGDFESNLNVFQATSHATGEELATVSQKAIDLGNDLGLPATSAKTAVDAMLALNRTGLSVTDTLAASRPALQLAAAGHLEAGKAAEFTGNALHVFRMRGDEANKVVDVMAALLPAAGSKIEQTAGAIRLGGTAATQAKIGIHDFATEVGLMAEAGLKGTRAGSALAQMYTNLQAPSKQGQQVLLALGVTIYDSTGRMKDQRTIIGELGNALNRLTAEDRDFAEKALFSANARRAANVVLLQGVDAYDRMHQKVTIVGQAQAQSDARMKGYTGSVEAFNNQIETLQITMGQKLLPQATKLIHGISDLVEQFNKLSNGQQGAVITATVAIGGMLLLGGKVLEFTNTILQIRAAWVAVEAAAKAAALAEAGAAGAGAAGAAAGGGGLLARIAATLGLTGAGTAISGALSSPGAAAAGGALSTAARFAGPAAGVYLATRAAPAGGPGGDIHLSAQATAEQLQHFRDQLRNNQAALDQLVHLSWDEQTAAVDAKFGTNLFGFSSKTPAAYESELRANIANARNRIATLTGTGNSGSADFAGAGGGDFGSGGDYGAPKGARSGSGVSDLRARITAEAAARKAATKAHQAELAETARFTKELKQEQERLSEALDSGDKSAQAFAARLVGLTAEHRAQITAVHEQVLAANEAEKARKKQAEVEERFQTLIGETENRVRTAHGTEVEGLEKLKASYPGVEEARLRAEIAHQAAASAAEKERENTDKLKTSLDNLKSAQLDAAAKDGVHKTAIQQTGKAYESLSKDQKSLVNQISDLKKEMDAPRAIDEWKRKIGEAAEKVKSLGYATASARDEIAKTQQRLNEQSVSLGGLDAAIEDREANGEADPGQVAYGRQLQAQMRQRGIDSQYRAQLYRQLQELGPGVTAQISDEDSRSRLQNEMRAEEDKLSKLKGQLKDNSSELSRLQTELAKLPTVNNDVAKSFDAITASLHSLTEAMQKTGNNIAGGLAHGMGAGRSQVQKSATSVSQSIVDQINGDLQIQSPSRVMANIGQYIVDGLAVGIKNGTTTVAGAASGMVQMTVAQAMSAVPQTLSAKETARQNGISSFFADQVVNEARRVNHANALAQGLSESGEDNLPGGYYDRLRKEAMNSDSLVVGGKTLTRTDAAQQMQGQNLHIGEIHLHINGVTDAASFQLSRPQIMQAMYDEMQSISHRNG